MLSVHERLAYYLAARDWYTFSGKILDCGVLVGGTTSALIYGVLNNQRCLHKIEQLNDLIYVYDQFIVGDHVYTNFFNKYCNQSYCSGDSFYPLFLSYMQPFQNFIAVQSGDITQQRWRDNQFIELLGLDICKRDFITWHIAQEFFPHLQADRSIVIQQDYSNGWLPHAIYLMEIFSDKFKKVFEVDDLAAFICTEPLLKEEIVNRLTYYNADQNRLMRLMDQAIAKAMTLDTVWFLKLAKVRLYGEHGNIEQGLAFLAELETQASPEIQQLTTYQSNFMTECQAMRRWLLRLLH